MKDFWEQLSNKTLIETVEVLLLDLKFNKQVGKIEYAVPFTSELKQKCSKMDVKSKASPLWIAAYWNPKLSVSQNGFGKHAEDNLFPTHPSPSKTVDL